MYHYREYTSCVSQDALTNARYCVSQQALSDVSGGGDSIWESSSGAASQSIRETVAEMSSLWELRAVDEDANSIEDDHEINNRMATTTSPIQEYYSSPAPNYNHGSMIRTVSPPKSTTPNSQQAFNTKMGRLEEEQQSRHSAQQQLHLPRIVTPEKPVAVTGLKIRPALSMVSTSSTESMGSRFSGSTSSFSRSRTSPSGKHSTATRANQSEREVPLQQLPDNKGLHWRMDPASSLSDWKLEIFNRSAKTFETYHVHRVVLALGPRACGSFRERIFANSNNRRDVLSSASSTTSTSSSATTSSKVTRVPLVDGACRYVPDFLDFVYDQPEFCMTRESAVPLLVLAQLFQQELLLEQARGFVQADMVQHAESLHHYYSDAMDYGQVQLVDHVMTVATQVLLCGKENYEKGVDLLELLSVEHFVGILKHLIQKEDDDYLQNTSGILASLIADYCILHQEELTLPLWERMTNYLLLSSTNTESATTPDKTATTTPKTNLMMDAKEAIILLQMDLIFRDESELQNHCLDVLMQDWESLLKDLDPQTSKILLQRLLRTNKPVIADWFSSTLIEAYQQLLTARKKCQSSLDRENSSQDDVSRILQERKQAQAELDTMKNRFATAKLEMKEQVQGWIRRYNDEQAERQDEQVKYEQERLLWQVERQQMLDEKARLEHELAQARKLLQDFPEQQQQQGPDGANRNCSLMSDLSWDESSAPPPAVTRGDVLLDCLTQVYGLEIKEED